MHIEQFEDLLNEVKEAYEKSALVDKQLYYSLLGTQIKQNQPLVVGLNWGGGSEKDLKKMKEKGEEYKPQTLSSYQKLIDDNTHFFSEGLDAGSLLIIKSYIEKYTDIDIKTSHIGWTNFCLFRTPDDDTLSNEAMELTKPIFLKLIEIIKPSMIICLSSKLRNYVDNNKKINFKNISRYEIFNENNRNIYNGLIGKLNGYPFYSLPHPSTYYRRGSDRKSIENAWKFCFEN